MNRPSPKAPAQLSTVVVQMLQLFMALALMAGALLILAPGKANASPAPVMTTSVVLPQHDGTSNGCTTPVWVPDFNNRFHGPCDTHDHCYNERWYGNSVWWGKAQCDWRFYREMLGTCPWWNGTCQNAALTYYIAVSGPGGMYAWYNSSWFH